MYAEQDVWFPVRHPTSHFLPDELKVLIGSGTWYSSPISFNPGIFKTSLFTIATGHFFFVVPVVVSIS